MTKVYSYRRFSTKPQANGDSSRRQTEMAERICREHGWTLDQLSFFDAGVSAFKGSNAKGELGKFLSAIEAGRIKAGEGLIVESLDRISRQKPLDAFDAIRRILSAGIFIFTGFDGQTYTTDSLNQTGGQIYILFGILQRAHDETKRQTTRPTIF